MKLEIINPQEFPNWDEAITAHEDCSFFHTSLWAKTLNKAYGYPLLYFAQLDKDQIKSLVPFMEVKSFLTGNRAVCLPFTDYCAPLVKEPGQFPELFDQITDFGMNQNWQYVEIKTKEKYLPKHSFYDESWRHYLELQPDPEAIYASMAGSHKRAIKKAVKCNVQIEFSHSLESINEFYALNCLTRKKHGLPPQPFYFIKEIHDNIISKEHGVVVKALIDGKVVAACVFFNFNDKAIYKYGASNIKYQQFRPNNLILWKAIEWYAKKGHREFCFGKTSKSNEGLRRFKQGWGTKVETITSHKFNLKSKSFSGDAVEYSRIYTKLFRSMPLGLLRLTGTVLYKHMG